MCYSKIKLCFLILALIHHHTKMRYCEKSGAKVYKKLGNEKLKNQKMLKSYEKSITIEKKQAISCMIDRFFVLLHNKKN